MLEVKVHEKALLFRFPIGCFEQNFAQKFSLLFLSFKVL